MCCVLVLYTEQRFRSTVVRIDGPRRGRRFSFFMVWGVCACLLPIYFLHTPVHYCRMKLQILQPSVAGETETKRVWQVQLGETFTTRHQARHFLSLFIVPHGRRREKNGLRLRLETKLPDCAV